MLKNKIIIVTGAAGGLGRGIFLEIIKRGGFPIGIDIISFKKSLLKPLLSKKNISSEYYKYYQADIRNNNKIKKIVSNKRIFHGIVNNAAILGSDNPQNKEDWEEKMSVNAKASYLLIKETINKLPEGASIVNIGSIELERPERNVIAYTSAKGALLGMTRAYATTLAEKNIRINMVSPSRVFTESNIVRLKKDKSSMNSYKSKSLIYDGKVDPQDVANLVCFLLSDESKKITGQNICIDCGFKIARES